MFSPARMLPFGLLSTALLVVTPSVHAQTCSGLPSIVSTSRTLSTSAGAIGSDRTVAVRYGVASTRAFLGLSAGFAGHELTRPHSPTVGFDAGYAWSVGSSGRTQLCSVLQSEYQRGPNGASYTNGRTTSALGISIGHAVDVTQNFGLIPFARVGVAQQHQSFAFTSSGPEGLGGWGQRNYLFGQTTLGVGLRLRDQLTITPAVTRPLLRNVPPGVTDVRFSLSASFGFKR